MWSEVTILKACSPPRRGDTDEDAFLTQRDKGTKTPRKIIFLGLDAGIAENYGGTESRRGATPEYNDLRAENQRVQRFFNRGNTEGGMFFTRRQDFE
jgi:hypothetical protein